MEELVEKSRAAIVDLATSILKKDPNTNLTSLVLDLPCSFFMLRTLSSLRLVTEVARSLHFARPLVELADIVVDGMTLGGKVRDTTCQARPWSPGNFLSRQLGIAWKAIGLPQWPRFFPASSFNIMVCTFAWKTMRKTG